MSNIQTTTLPSGLRIITDHVPSVESVALGIWAHVGTRNEDLKYNGVAHLVEHMLFKGTEKRSAQDIAEVIEDVGGHMNAYTSREVTSYHIHLLKDDTGLALDVLADMICGSNMPEGELAKERHVVLQEIGMCNDTPDDLVFDHFYETAYPDQAIGAPILGRAEIISAMRRDVLMGYVKDFYTPENLVISAAGNINHDAFVAQVGEAFAGLPENSVQEKQAAAYHGGNMRRVKDLEQAHIMLGFEGVSRLDEDYYAAQALSTILGGGMSSRLFQEIREKRGLVYSIYSFHSSYMDAGLFGLYAGTGAKEVAELIPAACDELMAVSADLRDEEVARVKAQMKANLLMGRESMMSRADQQAKYMIFRGSALDMAELTARIDALDKEAIASVAQKIFASPLTVSALGPLDHLEDFDAIKARFAA